MSSGLCFVVVLCLTVGLWTEANAACDCSKNCPSDWVHYGNKIYSYHSGPKSWIDAEMDCLSRNGNLASVHSDEEYKIVFDLIKKVTGKNTRAWIGGHDTVKEGSWLWSDGSDFWYKIFPKGQPSNYLNREHCLEMNWNNQPNDVGCHERKPYVCATVL